MIKAIIVDDEPDCCELLATLLNRYCVDVKILDICYSGEAAIQSINEYQPDILFLDIEMPFMNGFEVLERLTDINFDIIFTTSYDQYAIKAIRFSALDYLLKPIDREELQKSVQKAVQQSRHALPEQLTILLDKLKKPAQSISKVPIPTLEGFRLIAVDNILRCESEGNYTFLFLKSKEKVTASRTLKEMEEILEDFPFLRVHHSHIVHTREVEKYVRGEGGYLVMSDGTTVNVSRSRKDLLLKYFMGK